MPRLFISLDMPEEIINEISKIQKHIFQRNFIVGSFTKKENLHLTLKFLGEVPEDKVEEIKNNLSKIKFKKFKVHLGELGFFGDRIFWVELLGDEIFKLQKEVDDKLKNLFDAERSGLIQRKVEPQGNLGSLRKEKRFMSHITIARIKKMRKVPEKELENVKYSKGECEVTGFSLQKSVLTSEGAKYERLFKVEPD